jgi:hypothetical protein
MFPQLVTLVWFALAPAAEVQARVAELEHSAVAPEVVAVVVRRPEEVARAFLRLASLPALRAQQRQRHQALPLPY